ncbi:hypothetical protein CERSUDRAFT_78530, partial [Gelatoporia subvermispora B]
KRQQARARARGRADNEHEREGAHEHGGRADDEHAHVQRAQCSAGSGVMGGGVQRAALRAARSERTGGAQRAGGRREASACACAGSGGVSSSVQQGLEGRGGAARSEGAGERRCGRQVAGGAKRKASGRVARSKHEGGTGPSGRECGNFRKARAEPDARGAEKADSTGQAEKPRKMIRLLPPVAQCPVVLTRRLVPDPSSVPRVPDALAVYGLNQNSNFHSSAKTLDVSRGALRVGSKNDLEWKVIGEYLDGRH